jgi:hypothetical protein
MFPRFTYQIGFRLQRARAQWALSKDMAIYTLLFIIHTTIGIVCILWYFLRVHIFVVCRCFSIALIGWKHRRKTVIGPSVIGVSTRKRATSTKPQLPMDQSQFCGGFSQCEKHLHVHHYFITIVEKGLVSHQDIKLVI